VLRRHGIFHRDIKPENLLITDGTNLKLAGASGSRCHDGVDASL
jgi:hypothetical protein